eukprot:Colp12_sorted_trinity150504_noHs@28954
MALWLLPVVLAGCASTYYLGDRFLLFSDKRTTMFDPSEFGFNTIVYGDRLDTLPRFFAEALVPAIFFVFVRRLLKNKVFGPIGASFGLKKRKLVKFEEQAFLVVYYTFFFALEFFILRATQWWPPSVDREARLNMWRNWPEGQMDDQKQWGLRFFYTVQLGFYLHYLVMLFTERLIQRADLIEYFLHHCVTIGLMTFSWINYYHRIGSLVLFLHDCADIWLSFAKCLNYVKKETLANISFGVFVVSFAYSRLYLFPILIWSSAYESYVFFPPNLPSSLLTGLLLCLLPLHVFWFILVLKMIYRLMIVKTVEKDIRSDDESEGEKTPREPGSRRASRKED